MTSPAELQKKSSAEPDYHIYDHRRCACGESPLWHPSRKQLYWVDITHHKILTRNENCQSEIKFDEFVTALGWVDDDHIIAATETALKIVNLNTFKKTTLCHLEANNTFTRSNDGRVDPWGGFWISTMGKDAQSGYGHIYRFYEGQLFVVISEITIPNAICFDEKRNRAYFADTQSQKLYVIDLNERNGHPLDKPRLFRDFSTESLSIDGAITDKDGCLWLGVWGGNHILKLDADGQIIQRVYVGADRPTCVAFGGETFSDLYVTTAAIGLEETFEKTAEQGKTILLRDLAKGCPPPQFRLPNGFEIGS